jgi:aminobenzoyl-glutamate utilization protein B
MGGVPDCINPGMFMAGKTMACTMIDLFTNPDHLKKAWEEFNQRTGGGVGGDKWMSPLLSEDFDPPVDLRWPEYINTVRGEEWWIPTNNK